METREILLLTAFVITGFVLFIVFLRKIMRDKVEKKMRAMVDCHKNELLEEWGPPTSVFPFDNGKEIWSYNRIKQTNSGQAQMSSDSSAVDPPQNYTVKREFFIDKNGIVYKYRWENF